MIETYGSNVPDIAIASEVVKLTREWRWVTVEMGMIA